MDTNKFRLDKARSSGRPTRSRPADTAIAGVGRSTDGLGVDVAIEAVGYPETLRTAAALVRPGGTVANIGVHGVPVELPMHEMWIQNVTLTMGLVDTVSIPTLLTMVATGRIPAEKMGTHPFTFDRMDEAYDVFGDAAAHSGRGLRRHRYRRQQAGLLGLPGGLWLGTGGQQRHGPVPLIQALRMTRSELG